MIIKAQRGEDCPMGYGKVGDLNCEECDHFKHVSSQRVNEQGIQGSDEWCELILIQETNETRPFSWTNPLHRNPP